MAPPCVAIGFTLACGRRLDLNRSGEAPKILPEWAYFRTGRGRGLQIAAFFIIALPVTPMESRGIPIANKFGGTKQPANGLATTFRISIPPRIQKITWGRSL